MPVQIVSLQYVLDTINAAHTDVKLKKILKTKSLISIRDPKLANKLVTRIPKALLKTTSYKFIDDNASMFKHMIHATFDDIYADYVFKTKAPKLADVKKLLNWAVDKNDIIVHCTAGISRSSAIAYLIEYCKTKSISDALSILNNKQHSPNKLIVCHGASILNNSLVMTRLFEWEYIKSI